MYYLKAENLDLKQLAKDLVEHILNINIDKNEVYPMVKMSDIVFLDIISESINIEFNVLNKHITEYCLNSKLSVDIPVYSSDYNFLIKKKMPVSKIKIISSYNGNLPLKGDIHINVTYNKFEFISKKYELRYNEWNTILYDLANTFTLPNKFSGKILLQDLTLYNKKVFNINVKYDNYIFDILLKTYNKDLYQRIIRRTINNISSEDNTYLSKEENDMLIDRIDKERDIITNIPIYNYFDIVKIFGEKRVIKTKNRLEGDEFILDLESVKNNIIFISGIPCIVNKKYRAYHYSKLIIIKKKQKYYVIENNDVNSHNIAIEKLDELVENLSASDELLHDEIYVYRKETYEPIYKFIDWNTYKYFSIELKELLKNKDYTIHKFPYISKCYNIIDTVDVHPNLKIFYKELFNKLEDDKTNFYNIINNGIFASSDKIICSYCYIDMELLTYLGDKIYVIIEFSKNFSN